MIETWSLLFILAEEPKDKLFLINQEETIEDIEDCGEDVKEAYENVHSLRDSMAGLEFYMKDSFLKEERCPDIEWEQPDIEVYKKEPKSHLPEVCTKLLDTEEDSK